MINYGMSRRIFLALLAFVVQSGCSGTVRKNDLVGSYVAQRGYGREELNLGADGRYVQKFTPEDSTLSPATSTGNWDFDGKNLELLDAMLVDDFYGELSPKYSEKKHGLSYFTIDTHFQKLAFSTGANSNIKYMKQ